MMGISIWIIAPCLTGAIIVGSWVVGSMKLGRSIEAPEYRVLQKNKGYEIREYQHYIIAMTEVGGSYNESTINGFRVIAGYIFGNNVSRSSTIVQEVTSLGNKEDSVNTSERIPMTAPVISERIHGGEKGARYVVSFVMPSRYTLETLPMPRDPRVVINQVNKHHAAAIAFSGYTSERRVQGKRQQLRRALDKDNIRAKPGFKVAQYNPPWTFPWLRRNEVIVDLQDDSGFPENHMS
jgi:hypothetical protein